MQKECWYITDKQIKLARENEACSPALEWAEKERDWRKVSADWLGWDARNTKMCPAEVLVDLSRDSNWEIRYWVAQNPNTPAEVLTELSRDSNWGVRSSVARNPSTPVEALIELSKDSEWDVS